MSRPSQDKTSSIDPASNLAMKDEIGKELKTCEGILAQKLALLKQMLSASEGAALDNVQEQWRVYRTTLQEYARAQFAGHSHAALEAAAAALTETERRIKEIDSEIIERNSL